MCDCGTMIAPSIITTYHGFTTNKKLWRKCQGWEHYLNIPWCYNLKRFEPRCSYWAFAFIFVTERKTSDWHSSWTDTELEQMTMNDNFENIEVWSWFMLHDMPHTWLFSSRQQDAIIVKQITPYLENRLKLSSQFIRLFRIWVISTLTLFICK